MQLPEEGLLEFPCEFAIKVMGAADADFAELVLEIIARHVPDLPDNAHRSRPSSNGRFVSITVNFTARSRPQLDDLYRELTAHQRILMVL